MKRLFAIILCRLLSWLNISVAINVLSPSGEIKARTKVAIAIKCYSKQFENWNYCRNITALCDENSNCSECDMKDKCQNSKVRKVKDDKRHI